MFITPMKYERYLALRKVPIVTSSDKHSPVGIFSPSIFGVTEDERIKKFAFINLNCYILRPALLDIMRRIDTKIFNCATQTSVLYCIKDGILKIAEKEDETDDAIIGMGPEFLYANWDKIDKKKYYSTSGKYANNEMKNVLLKYTRDDCFTHYQYVEAISYRDEMGDSAILSNEENILYADIIRFSNILNSGGLAKHRIDIVSKVQNKCLELFDYIANSDVGPHGNFRTNILAKAVDDSSRMTILPVVYSSRKLGESRFGINSVGVPVQHLIANFRDFVVKYSKDFIESLYDNGYFGDTNHNRILAFYDKDFIEDKIAKMDDSYFRVSPFEKVNNDGTTSSMVIDIDIIKDGIRTREHKVLYWIEFFYIVLERYMNVYENKDLWVTRYPVDSMLSSQPLKPVPLTINSRYLKEAIFMGYEYKEFPYIIDWIVENYQEKVFENGCRVSSSTATSFNGR